MARYWYTLHSHPNKEEMLWRQVEANHIEVFYPRIRVHPVNPRSRRILPYFPGYMFVRADLVETGLSLFSWMPYSTGLVSYGGEPAAVADGLIAAIRERVGEILEAGGDLFDGLKQGSPVRIQGGPFEGYEAIFDTRISGSERVRVLLKVISDRRIPVELPAGQISKVPKRPPSGGKRPG
jgi:transcription antitermination factor NusG